jgi:hypothetical protein
VATVHLVEVIERITRLPDAGGQRRFAVEEERQTGREKGEITIAQDGFIGDVTIHTDVGDETAVRAP